jgi:hypothetical protein
MQNLGFGPDITNNAFSLYDHLDSQYGVQTMQNIGNDLLGFTPGPQPLVFDQIPSTIPQDNSSSQIDHQKSFSNPSLPQWHNNGLQDSTDVLL